MQKNWEKDYEKFQEISLHNEDSQRKIDQNTPENSIDDITFIPFIDDLSQSDFVVKVDVHTEVAFKKTFRVTHL